MFIFIGGLQPKTVILDKNPRTCQACGSFNAHLKRIDQYISLFFIPLFRIKKGIPFISCDSCHSVFDEQDCRPEKRSDDVIKLCPKCRNPLAPDFSFCPYCGRDV
jgi:hypothetical protein